MFHLFKKQNNTHTVTFHIEGMHCTSCVLNIDGALEDTEGVVEANTSYAGGTTIISFDPSKVTKKKLRKIIESLAYTVKEAG